MEKIRLTFDPLSIVEVKMPPSLYDQVCAAVPLAEGSGMDLLKGIRISPHALIPPGFLIVVLGDGQHVPVKTSQSADHLPGFCRE